MRTQAGPGRPADGIRRRPSGERPPLPRDLSGAARFWLAMLVLLALAPFLGLGAAGGSGGHLADVNRAVLEWFRDLHSAPLTAAANATIALASGLTLGLLRWAALIMLAVFRRWQHVLAFIVSMLVVGLVLSSTQPPMSPPLDTARNPALIAGQLAPSRTLAGFAATAVAAAYALLPRGRHRRLALAAGGVLLGAVALASMYLGRASPAAVVTGAIVGLGIPLIAFRLIAPEASFPVTYRRGRSAHLDIGGRRGEAILGALRDQLGIEADRVEPFGQAGSGGSTPLRIRTADGRSLFGKLYAVQHLRSDRLYKLGRMIRYGALEDEKPFNSVRRLVEYEDYMLRVLSDLGVASAQPHGFVELTPEREYLLVTEFLEGSEELLEAEVDRDVVRQALGIVRVLWDAGIAHRDVKPSNVMVRGGRVHLIDVSFSQMRPSPWRQAVDLANMMLVLGLRASPEGVYQEAVRLFSPEEVAEAFAATRGVTMPSQLRAAVKEDGRDLVRVFRRLAPARRPIRIQRWSVRRIMVTAAMFLGSLMALQLLFDTLRRAGLR